MTDESIAGMSGEIEPEAVRGKVVCHCTEDDGIPDVGISIGLGAGHVLWIGELLVRDGADRGFVFYGPGGVRVSCALDEIEDIKGLFRNRVAPALARYGASHGD